MRNEDFFKQYEDHNGFNFSESEKLLMIKQDFACDCCGNSFKDHLEDFQVVNDRCTTGEDAMLCYDCYQDDYLTECSICEDRFENPETPEETVLYINKYASHEVGLSIGFYQVLEFPYYLSDGFSINLFDNSIKKISNLDMRDLGRYDSGMSNSKVCPDCQSRYKGEKRIINNYINRKANMHQIIFERGLIKSALLQSNPKTDQL
jgi:hypothetical protein